MNLVFATKTEERRAQIRAERWAKMLQMLSEGNTTPQIAVNLKMNRRTVESHLAQIRAILGAKTITQAVAEAIRQGWIK